jgi:hypothetical protein
VLCLYRERQPVSRTFKSRSPHSKFTAVIIYQLVPLIFIVIISPALNIANLMSNVARTEQQFMLDLILIDKTIYRGFMAV